MSEKKQSLTTEPETVGFWLNAYMATPFADCGFLIASMMVQGGDGLRFHGLGAQSRTGEIRLIHEAEEPQDFDDFLVSFHESGKTLEADEDGVMQDAGPVTEKPRNCLVRPGERLILGVYNPTDKPITARVTFSGPEL